MIVMVGRFEVTKGLSWWPDGGAHGLIHYQYTPNEVLCYSDSSTADGLIPIALRPTVSVKLAVKMHHRKSPAC